MLRMIVLASEAAGPHEEVVDLPLPHIVYGAIALTVLLTLLGVTFMFRSVASRQPDRSHDRH